MNIYDVLRHLIEQSRWSPDTTEDFHQKALAIGLVDQLERANVFGNMGQLIREDKL